MMKSRSKILLFLLISFSHSSLFPLLGTQSLPWYKKDYSLVLMLLSAVGLYEYCGGMNSLDASRVIQESLGITEHDKASAKGKYFEQLTVDSRDCSAAPAQLSNLRNYEFWHMNSVEQIGPSCAWYMAFNARAIQGITQQQLPLTAANIREYITRQLLPLVEQNREFFKKLLGIDKVLGGMKFYQTPKLIAHLGIKNYYDVFLREKTYDAFVSADHHFSVLNHEKVSVVPIEGYDSKYLVPDVPMLLRSIKQNPAPVVHILLTVPSSKDIVHAVLLTIIKRGDNKPLLLYLNSNGNSLGQYFFDAAANTENSYITSFVTALDNA